MPSSSLPNETPGYPTFKWLNLAQFTGALNDNLFKFFAIFTLIDPVLDNETRVNTIGGAVFALPFLLFSEWGGVLADRFSKAIVIQVLKVVEILVMVAGVAALWSGHPPSIYAVLFLMAAQSALFGPNKYGIIPELVPTSRLSMANSVIQSMTYIAIIIGMVLAPALGRLTDFHYNRAAATCLAIAVVGALFSFRIHRTPAAGVHRPINLAFLPSIARTLWRIRGDRMLLLAIVGVSFFLFYGAFIQMNIIAFGKEKLGLVKEDSTLLFIPAALGIGLGSMLAGRLSGRNIEFGLVPVGACGMSLCAMLLWLIPARWDQAVGGALPHLGFLSILNQAPVTGALLLLLGASGGLFNVPLTAFVQWRTKREERGEVLAAENFVSWTGVVIAAALLGGLSGGLGLSAGQSYLVLGLLTVVLSVLALRLLPDFLTRFAGMVLLRFFYRLKVLNPDRLPVAGGALLVANHESWMDAFFIAAITQRRVRFIMWKGMFNRWKWPQPILRLMDTILIDQKDPPKAIIAALQHARRELDEGFLVCIFGEGMISRNGMMTEFKKGLEKILKGSEHPIVPVYLGGVWGSIFSYHGGRILGRRPEKLPYPVSVVIGDPLPSGTSAFRVQQRVAELSVEYADDLKATRPSLGLALIRSCRRSRKAKALADSSGKELSYEQTLAGALALRAKLLPLLGEGRNVGLWLPSSVGGALANLAVTLARRTVVNLNYTASGSAQQAALDLAGVSVVLSSRAFEEKAGACPPVATKLYLEDVLATITPADKVRAGLAARFAPAAWLAGREPGDAAATILFSSGSTSTPKGVVLSHHAIQSNIDSFRAVHQPVTADNMCSALPFFHAFGYTCALWYPLLSGFSVVYHPNPLEAATIGEMIEKHRSTISIATPSFLLAWLRKVKPEQLASLKLLVTGAEKLKPALAEAFREKFGITPMEGYGATELGPVVTVNIPDREVDTVFHVGHRPGTVGHPLPHVAVLAVDPETGEERGPGESGLLLVKSPARMTEYLGQPAKTAEVLRDGWYSTGDIGKVDSDGFVTIQDRLARFSKIAGEMVPHTAVEEALHQLAGKAGQVFVVVSLPDERKGEKLAVLHTEEALPLEPVLEALRSHAMPNLWKPDPRNFVLIPGIPLLGSGKLDMQKSKALAAAGLGAGA